MTPEVLYGGAAGGGKSVALLMAALQYVDREGYNAILLRRTFADLNLPEALIPLSHQWLQGTTAAWDGQKHQWRFPSGAVVQFGYLETEIDKYRYQGAAAGFIGFDELTQFTESQYRYLFSRLRKKDDANYPLRMRAASNPGGVGHEWVKKRFVAKAGNQPNRAFVPARLEDNPYLDRAAYEESLNQLDPITLAQLRSGDWDIIASCIFKRDWFRYYDKAEGFYFLGNDRKPVAIADCNRLASMDVAGTEKQKGNDPDFTVIQVWDITPAFDMILVEQVRGRFEIPDAAEQAVTTYRRFDCPYIFIEKNGMGLGVVQTVKRKGCAVHAVSAKRDKIARSQSAQIRMRAGSVYLPSSAPWLEDFEAELLAFGPEAAHDDQVDAFAYAAKKIGGAPEIAGDEEYTKAKEVLADAHEQAELDREKAERNAARRDRIESLDDESMWQEVM